MQYPLSSVHTLIYETIHPKKIVDQSELLEPSLLHWHQYKHDVKTARLAIITYFTGAGGSDALRARVHNCQVGCISLINRLSHYIGLTIEVFATKDDSAYIADQYSDLQRILISHLSYLNTYYASFVDKEQQIPAAALPHLQESLQIEIQNLRFLLSQTPVDPELVSIVLNGLSSLTKQAPVLYRHFYYYQSLLEDLQTQYDETYTPSSLQLPLVDFLIGKNFNHPVFTSYVIRKLREQIAETMTVEEQIEKWSYHVKEFAILTTVSTSLYPEYPSVKDTLITTGEKEWQYMQNQIKETPKTLISQSQPKERSLVTALTVSQLGVFMRLMTDLNIIQHRNQVELLRMVASHITTIKTAHISAESLRVRYYNPDKASIAITKEYLLQMLNRLKEY